MHPKNIVRTTCSVQFYACRMFAHLKSSVSPFSNLRMDKYNFWYVYTYAYVYVCMLKVYVYVLVCMYICMYDVWACAYAHGVCASTLCVCMRGVCVWCMYACVFVTVVFKLTNQIHQLKFTPSEYQLTFKLDQNFIIRQNKTEKEIIFFVSKIYK